MTLSVYKWPFMHMLGMLTIKWNQLICLVLLTFFPLFSKRPKSIHITTDRLTWELPAKPALVYRDMAWTTSGVKGHSTLYRKPMGKSVFLNWIVHHGPLGGNSTLQWVPLAWSASQQQSGLVTDGTTGLKWWGTYRGPFFRTCLYLNEQVNLCVLFVFFVDWKWIIVNIHTHLSNLVDTYTRHVKL